MAQVIDGIEPILPRPEVALEDMFFAPAISVSPEMNLVFMSGITAYPMDVDPWNPGDFKLPESIDEQTRLMTDNIEKVLALAGITWRHIIMMVKYSTELGGADPARERLGTWRPCSTTIGVHDIGVPGAKVLYDITAVAPGKA